jgi:transcription initiation factor TFIID subunit 5
MTEETPNDSPGKQVRKLVGHSGPVYSVAFDPIAGSVYPPSHLLSSSQDGSVRLWSMDTFKNLVVYKGHADPVWAVEWGPYGAYFATASRDRTARLWITDRVAPLRMFAGHLSDVDVSQGSEYDRMNH